MTRAREALTADRRALPMVEVGKEYVFEGGSGRAGLLDLFDGRQQLVVHHFMFAPERQAGCRCCAAFLDQVGHLAHLHARGTSFAAVSRAPFTRILPFKARMGWTVPWYSSYEDDFNADFEATVLRDGASPSGRGSAASSARPTASSPPTRCSGGSWTGSARRPASWI